MHARSCSLPPCPFSRARSSRDGGGDASSSSTTSSSLTSTTTPGRARAVVSKPRAVRAPDGVTVPTREALERAKTTSSRAVGKRTEGRRPWEVMAFAGWAPETVNGRCAQVGAAVTLWNKYAPNGTHDGVLTQAHDHVVLMAIVIGVVTAGSFAPSALGETYGGEPKSYPIGATGGVFTARKEMIHGRIAMIALAVNAYAELQARGIVPGFPIG